MPSQIHNRKETIWLHRLKEDYHCKFVEREYSFRLGNSEYRIDVYGKDKNHIEYFVECGTISVEKLIKLREFTRQKSFVFIHDAYTKEELAELGHKKNVYGNYQHNRNELVSPIVPYEESKIIVPYEGLSEFIRDKIKAKLAKIPDERIRKLNEPNFISYYTAMLSD